MAVKIGEYTHRGKKAFKRLTELHPHSIEHLHKHASFLAEVCNEGEHAQRLMIKADFLSRNLNDRGEGRQHRDHGETGLNANAGKLLCVVARVEPSTSNLMKAENNYYL